MCCHHHGQIDYSKLDVKLDQEPIKQEDGTYEVPLKTVTAIGNRTLESWGNIVGMHVCSAICAATIGGLLIGALVMNLLKK